MAVSDISGLPILEVFSDDRVVAGKYNSNALVVTGSRVGIGKATPSPSVALDVTGSAFITGSLNISSTFSSNALWTVASALSYWGGYPTIYGVLTWDTGYASVAASTGNKLYLSANGSTTTGHMIITTGGDVTINKTTAANGKLDVNGNATITGSLQATTNVIVGNALYLTPSFGVGMSNGDLSFVGGQSSGTGGPNIKLENNGHTYINVGTGITNGNVYVDGSSKGGSFTVRNFSNSYFTDGNVGIGKGTANATLDVNGTAIVSGSSFTVYNPSTSAYGYFINSFGTGRIATSGFYMYLGGMAGMGTIIQGSGSNMMTFDGTNITVPSGKNVGIGKGTANATLDVNGNAIITGSLTVTGNINGNIASQLHPFLFLSF